MTPEDGNEHKSLDEHDKSHNQGINCILLSSLSLNLGMTGHMIGYTVEHDTPLAHLQKSPRAKHRDGATSSVHNVPPQLPRTFTAVQSVVQSRGRDLNLRDLALQFVLLVNAATCSGCVPGGVVCLPGWVPGWVSVHRQTGGCTGRRVNHLTGHEPSFSLCVSVPVW